MKYKLKPNIRRTLFLQTVDSCRGEIYFEDRKGDRLDLKSQLSKYLFLTIVPGEDLFSEGWITCQEKDSRLLASFLDLQNNA